MINLGRLMRSRDVKAGLGSLAQGFGLHAHILSAKGEVLWCGSAAEPETSARDLATASTIAEYPITLDGQTLGTVRGTAAHDAEIYALATLVTHLARQESEKSALIQDALARYGEVNAYYELSKKLAGNLNPTQVAETVLAEATTLIKADRGFVLVQREDGQGLEMLAHMGAKPSKKLLKKEPGGVTGAIYRSGRAEIVNDLTCDLRHTPGEVPACAFIGVPLVVKGITMGVVCVTMSEPHEYRTEDLNLLSALSVSAASAIENARLYKTMERRVAARTLELFETLNRFNHELVKAGDYVKSLIPQPETYEGICTDWRFVPSTSLGGDIFGYHWMDENRFVIYLLDVCGHGIGAALLSVSVMNVLRSRALPETDFSRPEQVLQSLNRTFPMEEHNGMYFTTWYGVFDRATRKLTYASGGHFPALFFPGKNGVCDNDTKPVELVTPNLFIGGVPGFPYVEKTYQVPADGRLYVFSDGTFEHRQPDGTMWEYDEFKEFLRESTHMSAISELAASPMDNLLAYGQRLHQSPTLKDDFTILQIDFTDDTP